MQRTVWRYRSKRIAGTLYGLFYPFFCIGWVLLCLNGCSQEVVPGGEPEVSEGELAVIRLNVRANTTDQISTRAINDSTIHDLHILVYNSAGELTGKSYQTEAPYTVTARSGTDCTIYAIANTGNSALFDGTVVSTEPKLKDLTTNIASWNSMGTSNYLLMTGSKPFDIDPGESTLTGGMTVSRLAAKVKLAIGVADASGITITNYKICSLPVNSYYINRPLTTEGSKIDTAGETGTEPNNTSTESHWTNSGLIDAGGASSVNTTFYMFENRRGVNSSIAAQNQKIKANAPDSATYVVINGEGSGFKATWKVYLGADNTANFNMKRNCSYTYTITLKRNDTDSRVTVEQTTPVIVGGNANCYMVAPGTAVTIPVERANESPIAITGATLTNGTYYQILSGTTWTASVLWESTAGLVSVSNQTGTGPAGRFTVTANTPVGTGGNAVVQIKNGSNVLWSWHIWVTDYNPSSNTYTINNGYRNYVFMDRNLGATRNDYNATDAGSKGLLYQWGRKDPFPNSSAWTTAEPTLSGETIQFATTTGLTQSIRYPAHFIKGSSNWSGGGDATLYLWNAQSTAAKTVFDPCPAGWRVPAYYGAAGTPSSTDYSPWRYWNNPSGTTFSNSYTDLSGSSVTYGGIYNTTYKGYKFTRAGVETYYPASGYRDYSTGAFSTVGTNGYYWSASPSSTYGYSLSFGSSGGVSPAYGNYRAYGFSVRCVQE
ncbi:DUF4906 domain-containing protein [Bacteroides graminisolvens]|uniref:DUF4906 domain-containing protein n=1 Tax=Bacteroides graminisolvens TaxID=477666 RepID=UPI0029C6FD7D|nr:DUF4906 domain-containing protein [Bacteroides graminisolvens]